MYNEVQTIAGLKNPRGLHEFTLSSLKEGLWPLLKVFELHLQPQQGATGSV